METTNKLFNKNYTMVVLGQMISIFGNWVLRVALSIYILDKTGSETIFGSIMAIATIPTILLSPIGGVLADRRNKRNLMVILDMITAIIIILAGYVLSIDSVSIIIFTATLMILFSVIQAFYQPAVQASLPIIVSDENLEKANGIVSLVNAFSSIAAPVAAGILYYTFGMWPIMFTGFICFLFASIMEMFIKMEFAKKEKNDTVINIVKEDLKISLKYLVKTNPVLFKGMLLVSGINLFLTSFIIIGLPSLILIQLNYDSDFYGYTQGFMGVGMIIGAITISVLGEKVKVNKVYKLLIITVIMILPMGIAFTLNLSNIITYLIISLSCFVMMAMIAMFNIKMMSFLQRETPKELLGKIMSYALVLPQCTLPIGQFVYGILFDIGTNYISLIIYVTALCSLGVALYSKKVFNGLKTDDNEAKKV